ncbi:MAG: hypothetical protein WKF96_25130 [Solirubrobacteraceae bacterium]
MPFEEDLAVPTDELPEDALLLAEDVRGDRAGAADRIAWWSSGRAVGVDEQAVLVKTPAS